MANKWLAHVKKTMKSHKGMKFGQVLKMAKKTYKGGAGGEPTGYDDFGSDADIVSSRSTGANLNSVAQDAYPLNGAQSFVGARRRSRKTRKTRRGGKMY